MSQKAANDLWNHNPDYVVAHLQQLKQNEQQQLANWEQEAAQKRLQTRAIQFGGDLQAAQRAIDAEDQQQAQREQQRQLDAQHGRELEQRLQRQRDERARMAGVLL